MGSLVERHRTADYLDTKAAAGNCADSGSHGAAVAGDDPLGGCPVEGPHTYDVVAAVADSVGFDAAVADLSDRVSVIVVDVIDVEVAVVGTAGTGVDVVVVANGFSKYMIQVQPPPASYFIKINVSFCTRTTRSLGN